MTALAATVLVMLSIAAAIVVVAAFVRGGERRPRLLPPEELERLEIEAGLVPGYEGAVALQLKDGRRGYRLRDGCIVQPPSERERP